MGDLIRLKRLILVHEDLIAVHDDSHDHHCLDKRAQVPRDEFPCDQVSALLVLKILLWHDLLACFLDFHCLGQDDQDGRQRREEEIVEHEEEVGEERIDRVSVHELEVDNAEDEEYVLVDVEEKESDDLAQAIISMLQDKSLYRNELREADIMLMLLHSFLKRGPIANLDSNIRSLEHVIIIIAIADGQGR